MSTLYLTLFLLIPAMLALFGIVWIAVGARGIQFWVALYLVMLLYFPNNNFGLLDNASGSASFYDRGNGVMFFPAINVLLFGMALQAFFTRRLRANAQIAHNLGTPALLFWIILLGNVVVGLSLDDVHWQEVFGRGGLMNVANLMLFFYVLTSSVRSRADVSRLVDIFIFCAVTRGIWGLARYLALGGDPANFYANFQHIQVKISFFDINDSLIATVSAFLLAWRLLKADGKGMGHKFMLLCFVGMELLIVALTHRRVSLGGVAVAAIIFAFSQRARIKYILLSLYVAAAVPAMVFLRFQRDEQASHAASFLERLLPDITANGQISFTTGRFAELYAAYLSLRDSPILGLGSWGQFSGFRFSELAWHGGNYGYMHSGILHIALKSGLVGVFVMFWVVIGYCAFVARSRRNVSPEMLGVMLAAFAGSLFLVPSWLIGTPVIEFRSMQMVALMLALPYMAYAVGRAPEDSNAHALQRARLGGGASAHRYNVKGGFPL